MATKKPKTYVEACRMLGIRQNLPIVKGLPKAEQKAIVAHYKLTVIARALNGGWVPNWNDSNQWKYYPCFDMRGGFSCNYCNNWHSNSDVGSRLCFKSRELAEYAGKTFLQLYKDYFQIE